MEHTEGEVKPPAAHAHGKFCTPFSFNGSASYSCVRQVYQITTQRSLLESTTPRLMIPQEKLRDMTTQLTAVVSAIHKSHLTSAANGSTAGNPTSQASGANGEVALPGHAASPLSQNNISGLMGPPGLNRPAQAPPVAPSLTKPVPPAVAPSPASTSAPTPVASTSTPGHTPAAASPPVPKSPTKAAAKPKAVPHPKRNRKGSKATQPATPVPAPTPATSNVETTSVPTPAASQSTSESTPQNTLKRPREEESSAPEASGSDLGADRVAKKIKTEWDGSPSAELMKKEQEVDDITSSEGSTNFLELMASMVNTIASDPQIDPHTNILDMVQSVLLQFESFPVNPAPTATAPSAAAEASTSAGDDMMRYLDFASAEADDDVNTASTPDLVAASANPSPESGTSGSPNLASATTSTSSGTVQKVGTTPFDELSFFNDRYLTSTAAFDEIDGGESSYYMNPDWKFEGPMVPLDFPWAITSS